MIFAKQSTAQIVTIGPILDADGVADEGVVVGAIKISKNGGAPAALNGSATLTHRHTGFYSLSLTATDLNTVGTVEITIDDTTSSMKQKEIQVVEGATYDVLLADSAVGPASVTQAIAIYDALTAARPEPGQGALAVNASLVEKIDYLYKFLRNRVASTNSQISVYADDATTVDHKATRSDNGTTFDRGEFATGP